MMKTFKVEANETLFNEFKTLGEQLKNLASIVANDAELPGEQILAWSFRAIEMRTKIAEAEQKVLAHIYKDRP